MDEIKTIAPIISRGSPKESEKIGIVEENNVTSWNISITTIKITAKVKNKALNPKKLLSTSLLYEKCI